MEWFERLVLGTYLSVVSVGRSNCTLPTLALFVFDEKNYDFFRSLFLRLSFIVSSVTAFSIGRFRHL